MCHPARAAKREKVSNTSINRIGSFLFSRNDGDALLTLPAAPPLPRPNLPLGSRVRIKRGVFEGVEGTLSSYKPGSRLVIDVDLNCRGVSIEIDAWMIERLGG